MKSAGNESLSVSLQIRQSSFLHARHIETRKKVDAGSPAAVLWTER
jgi:hypothetical protein